MAAAGWLWGFPRHWPVVGDNRRRGTTVSQCLCRRTSTPDCLSMCLSSSHGHLEHYTSLLNAKCVWCPLLPFLDTGPTGSLCVCKYGKYEFSCFLWMHPGEKRLFESTNCCNFEQELKMHLLQPKGATVIQPLVSWKAKISFFADQAAVNIHVWAARSSTVSFIDMAKLLVLLQ